MSDREEIYKIDEQIAENCEKLDSHLKHNLEIVSKISKEHVLGEYKQYLEARVKSLQLHIENLRAKRKYF